MRRLRTQQVRTARRAAIPAGTALPGLLVGAAPAQALREERIVHSASQLQALCREQAEARYAGAGEPVYQWTGSHHDYANTLFAEGKLRVDGRDVAVKCRSARNARERHITVEFDDPGR